MAQLRAEPKDPGSSVSFHRDYYARPLSMVIPGQVSHCHLCFPAFQIPPHTVNREDLFRPFKQQESVEAPIGPANLQKYYIKILVLTHQRPL